MTVLQSIFRRAQATPDRLALTYVDEEVSYASFARRIQAARQYLKALELRPDAVAVVCVFHLVDAWVLHLALASLGVTTMAVRFLHEVQLAEPMEVGCVFVSAREWQGEKLDPADGADAPLIVVPAGFDAPRGGDGPPAARDAVHEGGHIVFTAGTTGAPKKVLIDRTNQAAYLAQRLEGFSITEQSMVNLVDWGLWSSVGYSVPLGIWSLGGAVALHTSPLRLNALQDPRLTHAILTPTMLAQILSSPPGSSTRRDDVRVYVGGGPLSKTLAIAAKATLTTQLYNIVASTEAGLWCVTPIREAEDVTLHQVLPSRLVQIVDERGENLPAGREGLIWVACLPGVESYLDDAEATSAFFRGGYFYPGDLGMLTPAGRLVLLGRATEVITANSQKIATGPIEQALQDRFGAAEVCVFSFPGENGPEELHVVIQPLKPIDRDELVAMGRSYLELFPQVHFHLVEAMPRSDRGKVLRAALKRQVLAGAPAQPAPEQRTMATPT